MKIAIFSTDSFDILENMFRKKTLTDFRGVSKILAVSCHVLQEEAKFLEV